MVKISLIILLLTLTFPSFSQIKKGTVVSTGSFQYIKNVPGNFKSTTGQVEAGVFFLKNTMIGAGFGSTKHKRIDILNHTLNDSYNTTECYIFLRRYYPVKPGFYLFIQPLIKKELRKINYNNSSDKGLEKAYSGSLQAGLNLFLTKNLALEVIPIALTYTESETEIETFRGYAKKERSDLSFSLFPTTNSTSLKLFLFSESYRSAKDAIALEDKIQLSGTFKFNRFHADTIYTETDISVIPSAMVYHSKFFAAGFSLGFEYFNRDNLAENNHRYLVPGQTTTTLSLGSFLRFNKWLNNQTALFASPYGNFGIGFRKNPNMSPTGPEDDMLFIIQGGINLGISVLVSPKVVIETYSPVLSYNHYQGFSYDFYFKGVEKEETSTGLSLTNLYLSLGFLID